MKITIGVLIETRSSIAPLMSLHSSLHFSFLILEILALLILLDANAIAFGEISNPK